MAVPINHNTGRHLPRSHRHQKHKSDTLVCRLITNLFHYILEQEQLTIMLFHILGKYSTIALPVLRSPHPFDLWIVLLLETLLMCLQNST